MEKSNEQKTEYLKEKILDAGYEGEEFINFMSSIKGFIIRKRRKYRSMDFSWTWASKIKRQCQNLLNPKLKIKFQ